MKKDCQLSDNLSKLIKYNSQGKSICYISPE